MEFSELCDWAKQERARAADELAVLSTLRASTVGCSDAELWRWRAVGGSWNPFAEPVHGGRVADGLTALRGWAKRRSRRAQRQGEDAARVSETVLPETDTDVGTVVDGTLVERYVRGPLGVGR